MRSLEDSLRMSGGVRANMESETGIRALGIISALLLGGVFPVFIFGPVIFEQMPITLISTPALVSGISFALLGVWLLLVSCIVPVDDLKKILEPFGAAEAVVLFLPYMLYIGTRSAWRRVRRSEDNE